MLEGLLSMIRTIAAMSVINMLIEYLAPEGTFENNIRMITGLVFLLIVIQPLCNFADSLN